MEKRVLGRTGMEVTALGYGGAEIGYESASPETVERLLNEALDAGLNVIDTAECYLTSEELIGRAAAHRRKDYFLFTKCGHASGLNFPDWHPKLITESIERSLKRLQTDVLDLVQLHSCDEATLKQGDVIEALQRARDAGKTRFIGYSGDSRAVLYATQTEAFDTLQTSVSVADQEAIDLTLPEVAKRNMGVIAKRPIANAAWRYGDQRPNEPYHIPYWERLKKLDYDFTRGDTKTAVETALRFTLSVPGVATMIVGTSKPGRWRENAEIVNKGKLPESEYESIRRRWREVVAENPDAQWVGQI